LKAALNNAKLSRILTLYLPANQPFHANLKFQNRGGAETSPNTHEGDTGRAGAGCDPHDLWENTKTTESSEDTENNGMALCSLCPGMKKSATDTFSCSSMNRRFIADSVVDYLNNDTFIQNKK
jgi:hypothetical protein